MGDVWEEGYGLKELNKRSAELLERKVVILGMNVYATD